LFPLFLLLFHHHGDRSGGTFFRTDAATLAVEKIYNEITFLVKIVGHIRTEDVAQTTMDTKLLIENWFETLPIACPILTGIARLQDDVSDRYFLPCPFIFWFGHE
jgi:hypothetical protein